ncbi:MAG: nucleotidyltransferase domain-containing protein [Oscillospiraceae bacterium]|nr:nucleotidyltransferase domain-containing protein [Oscillospiraceae bacterium]
MVYTLSELRQKLTPIAEKHQLETIYVFGSYAREDVTEDSDIDLLVDASGSGLVGWDFGGLYEDLKLALKKDIDMITTDALSDYERDIDKEFSHTVLNERVAVYERT